VWAPREKRSQREGGFFKASLDAAGKPEASVNQSEYYQHRAKDGNGVGIEKVK